MPELALDHPERVFNLGPDARLYLFELVQDRAPGLALIQQLRLPGRIATCQLTLMPWVSARLSTPW